MVMWSVRVVNTHPYLPDSGQMDIVKNTPPKIYLAVWGCILHKRFIAQVLPDNC